MSNPGGNDNSQSGTSSEAVTALSHFAENEDPKSQVQESVQNDRVTNLDAADQITVNQDNVKADDNQGSHENSDSKKTAATEKDGTDLKEGKGIKNKLLSPNDLIEETMSKVVYRQSVSGPDQPSAVMSSLSPVKQSNQLSKPEPKQPAASKNYLESNMDMYVSALDVIAGDSCRTATVADQDVANAEHNSWVNAKENSVKAVSLAVPDKGIEKVVTVVTVEDSIDKKDEQNEELSGQDISERYDVNIMASNSVQVMVPVICCMTFVALNVEFIPYFRQDDFVTRLSAFPGISAVAPTSSDSSGETLKKSLLIAAAVVILVVIATSVIVSLYVCKFYKFLMAYFFLAASSILFFLSAAYLGYVLVTAEIPMDYITFFICIYNFAVVGIWSIFYKAPLKARQTYLVLLSALVALKLLLLLPKVYVWTILATLVVWDIVAVLTPCGPLKILVETAQQRGDMDTFNSLIYSSTIIFNTLHYNGKDTNESQSSFTDLQMFGDQIETLGANTETRGANTETLGSNTLDDQIETLGANNNAADDTASGQPPGNGQKKLEAKSQESHVDDVIKKIAYKEPGDSKLVVGYDSNTRISLITEKKRPTLVTTYRTRGGSSRTHDSSKYEAFVADARNRGMPPTSENAISAPAKSEGIKLGLGDFIFYSLMVGSAAGADSVVTITVGLSILIGLLFTLLLLTIFKKALPALPISIIMGIVAYLISSNVSSFFLDHVASAQIFI